MCEKLCSRGATHHAGRAIPLRVAAVRVCDRTEALGPSARSCAANGQHYISWSLRCCVKNRSAICERAQFV